MHSTMQSQITCIQMSHIILEEENTTHKRSSPDAPHDASLPVPSYVQESVPKIFRFLLLKSLPTTHASRHSLAPLPYSTHKQQPHDDPPHRSISLPSTYNAQTYHLLTHAKATLSCQRFPLPHRRMDVTHTPHGVRCFRSDRNHHRL